MHLLGKIGKARSSHLQVKSKSLSRFLLLAKSCRVDVGFGVQGSGQVEFRSGST